MIDAEEFKKTAREIFAYAVKMASANGPLQHALGEAFINGCISTSLVTGITTGELNTIINLGNDRQHSAEWELCVRIAKAINPKLKSGRQLKTQEFRQLFKIASAITLQITNIAADKLLDDTNMLGKIASESSCEIYDLKIETLKAKVEANHNPQLLLE